MLVILIVTIIQVLYWFAVNTGMLLDLLPSTFSAEHAHTLYLLNPFSLFAAANPNAYIVLQCTILAATFICALFIFFSKKYTVKTKIGGGVSLIGILASLTIPSFAFAAVLNLCISIPLLCFVIADYRDARRHTAA